MKCFTCRTIITRQICTCGCGREKPGYYVPYRGKARCLACAMKFWPDRKGTEFAYPIPGDNRHLFTLSGGRTIGLEIEGNWPLDAMVKWHELPCIIKHDGSLRGAAAAEVITPTPTILDQFNYEEYIDASPLDKVVTYQRAGIHVWFGIPDYTWRDAYHLLLWAALYEAEIRRYVTKTRPFTNEHVAAGTPMSLNAWLHPLAARGVDGFATIDSNEKFVKSLYGVDPYNKETGELYIMDRRPNNGGRNYPGPINRTMWLNIAAYFHSRCIEVRLLHTTPSKAYLKAWIEFWLRVIERIKGKHLSNIAHIVPSTMLPSISAYMFQKTRLAGGAIAGQTYTKNEELIGPTAGRECLQRHIAEVSASKGWIV